MCSARRAQAWKAWACVLVDGVGRGGAAAQRQLARASRRVMLQGCTGSSSFFNPELRVTHQTRSPPLSRWRGSHQSPAPWLEPAVAGHAARAGEKMDSGLENRVCSTAGRGWCGKETQTQALFALVTASLRGFSSQSCRKFPSPFAPDSGATMCLGVFGEENKFLKDSVWPLAPEKVTVSH